MSLNLLSRLRNGLVALGLALALAASATAPAVAQEISPEQLALARKYVDLTNKAGIYEAILVQSAQNTSKLLSQQSPDITDKINTTIGSTLEEYRGKNDELFNQFARVYATLFTQDELQQIVTFYESPVGQKLASSALDINESIQAVMQVYRSNVGTEFLSKVRTKLRAEGYNV